MARRSTKNNTPPPIDEEVSIEIAVNSMNAQIGERIRIRRLQLGLSLDELAGRIGVNYQQVQKYETGDRVAGGRLMVIAKALKVSINYFFGIEDATAGVDTRAIRDSIGLLTERGATDVLAAYRQMNPTQRRAFLDFGNVIADANQIKKAAA